MARPCEYVAVLRPIWVALAVFAAWPQYISKTGRLVRAPLCSARTFFTAVAYCIFAWRTVVVAVDHVQRHFTIPAGDMPNLLLNVQFGIYAMNFALLTFFFPELRRNAEIAARWHYFQPLFQRVCGRPLRNDRLRREAVINALALSLGWPPFVCVPLLFDFVVMPISETLYLAILSPVFTFATTSWRVNCYFLTHAGDMFVDALAKALQREALTRKEVARFMTTWLQLRDLAHAGMRSIELTNTVNIFVLTSSNVVCAFYFVYGLTHGFNTAGRYLCFGGCLSTLTVIRICNLAHIVNDTLGTKVAVTLARSPISHFPKETIHEIRAFCATVAANPVKISLYGCLPLNRSTLGAINLTTVTYIVMLVQYSVDA